MRRGTGQIKPGRQKAGDQQSRDDGPQQDQVALATESPAPLPRQEVESFLFFITFAPKHGCDFQLIG